MRSRLKAARKQEAPHRRKGQIVEYLNAPLPRPRQVGTRGVRARRVASRRGAFEPHRVC